MKLRHVIFKVRPATEHPMYWDWQCGFLCIWLFGSSVDDAAEHARAILEELPYEIVEGRVSVRDCEPETGGNAMFKPGEQQARQVGLAIILHACAPGVDEGAFETMEPP